jgi:hypothetical protein
MNTPGYFCIDDFIDKETESFLPPAGQQEHPHYIKTVVFFVAWRIKIVTRGYKDISNPLSGYVNAVLIILLLAKQVKTV